MASGFTRQEVLSMTGIKPGNLSYLDSSGLVVPEKRGNPKRPSQVVYTVEQTLQIKIIQRLREKLSMPEVKRVLTFLKEQGYKSSLFECKLFFVGDKLYLIENAETLGKVIMMASGKQKGQLMIQEIEPLKGFIKELRQAAEEEAVLDFQKRTKNTPLEVLA